MITIRASFRNGFYAGLLVAAAAGVYLFELWQPERQVELHSAHLLHAFEQKDLRALEEFFATEYADQWGHDRGLALSRIREMLRYTRGLRMHPGAAIIQIRRDEAEWSARITIGGEGNEVTAFIRERINPLEEAFALTWRRQSWKPWEWKLVRVSHPALELPESAF